MQAPWRKAAQPAQIDNLPPDTRATAQLALLRDLLTTFLAPELAQTGSERARLQMLGQTVRPVLSMLMQTWDASKADATAAILRDIGRRQLALDTEWNARDAIAAPGEVQGGSVPAIAAAPV